MKQDETHKYAANLAFKLLLFLIACFAGIGILVLFEVLSKNISI
jgi:hypothetical protein